MVVYEATVDLAVGGYETWQVFFGSEASHGFDGRPNQFVHQTDMIRGRCPSQRFDMESTADPRRRDDSRLVRTPEREAFWRRL